MSEAGVARHARDEAILQAYESLHEGDRERAQVFAALAAVHHAVALDEDCGCEEDDEAGG